MTGRGDAWYCGKKKGFGGNIQALFYPDGHLMWISDVLPGRDGDLGARARSEKSRASART